MKYLTSALIFVLITVSGICQTIQQGQKPVIDSSVYNKWPSIEGSTISNNGEYMAYSIRNQPAGSRVVIFQSIHRKWKISISNASSADFTQDNYAAITVVQDTLLIIKLSDGSIKRIGPVNSLRLPAKGNGQWMAYLLKEPRNELVLYNLKTDSQRIFGAVDDYLFSKDGDVLLFQARNDSGNSLMDTLNWVTLANGRVSKIRVGPVADDFIFFGKDSGLVFTAEEEKTTDRVIKSIWYYEAGSNRLEMVASDRSAELQSKLGLDKLLGFSMDGSTLFVSLKDKENSPKNPAATGVNVWSYKDQKLQSLQLQERGQTEGYFAAIDVKQHSIIRLTQENEYLTRPALGENLFGDYAVVDHRNGSCDFAEINWNPSCRGKEYLLSTRTGSRRFIRSLDGLLQNNIEVSPDAKYIVFYDGNRKSYFSYCISSGQVSNISQSIDTKWKLYGDVSSVGAYSSYQIAGWVLGDSAVLVYDQNDIWELDLAGKKRPVNLTNGYGHQHNIAFRLANEARGKIIKPNAGLLLSAFNRMTKENGFYRIFPDKTGSPEKLTMGHYVYEVPGNNPDLHGAPPTKARDTEAYIVRRMSATESPNYFFTTDFKTFVSLSDIHPERNYNWLTTELLTWKMDDGELSQGVLYKPDNFNPRKKYPVIFYYYRNLSDGLYDFLQPGPAIGPLNIPWYVSNGYLIFTPDMHFVLGKTGQSALYSLMSAAKYLSGMPWVNAKKMGIQGHSFGGFETNYIVTHSHLFAAACAAEGMTDLISGYGGLSFEDSKQGQFELGPYQIGTDLWKGQQLYTKNSAVLYANNVTTPFLMMYNKGDWTIPFAQGVELFTDLRRLGKKAWMLQYDDGTHSVWGRSADDLSIRMAQFFDYYLKDAAPPKWMTEGIPASRKGIDTGLELDSLGKVP
jgi:dienelactone hydrolase